MKIATVTMGSGRTYHDVSVHFTKYWYGGTAIVLGDPGDMLGIATVYMHGVPPSPGCVWIKNWSENEGVLESLTQAGLIEPTGRTTPAGFTIAHEARLLVTPTFDN